MPIRILPVSEKRKAKRGEFRTAKKHVPNVAKSAQHPHSKLKTQKELKKITDSSSYKKADYKGKTEMLGGKVYARGGRAGFQGGGRTRLLEELGRVEAEPSNRNRRAEISRVHGELNKGYKGGGRIGLKSGASPKHGKGPKHPIQPLPPDYWKDRLKDLGKRYRRPRENLIEKMGGSEKAKPHSSEKGRIASGERRIRRILASEKPKGKGRPRGYDPPKWKRPERIMTPALRAKKAVGGKIIQKIVSKLKPKPKKIPEGKVDQKFLDFIKTGKRVDKHGVKVNVPKAAERLTGKPHVDHGKRKRTKHLGKGKAEGGRIKKGNGGSTMQQHYLQHGYGPHKIQLRSGKPKLAKKGW